MQKRIEKYLNDQDVMLVAYKAASSFSKSLSKEEIKSCIMKAIWKASKKYNKRNKTKFTSYLHRGVTYECLSQYKSNKRRNSSLMSFEVDDKSNPFERIDMIDLINCKCEDPELIIDRFYKNMTIKELAKARNVCHETIRIRLKKNIEKLKLSMTNGVY